MGTENMATKATETTTARSTPEGRLRWTFEAQATYARESAAKWAAEFAKNPAYTLEWGESAFEAAASLQVALHVLKILENVEVGGADVVVAELRQETLRRSRNPTRSTSQSHNLMDQMRLAAYSAAYESAKRTVDCAREGK